MSEFADVHSHAPGTFSRLAKSLRPLVSWFFPVKRQSELQFAEHECAALLTYHTVGTLDVMDEQSWRDLLGMDSFKHIAQGASIFGQQILYRRLRGGCHRELRKASCAQIAQLREDPDLQCRVNVALKPLHQADTEIATLLFDDQALAPLPRWLGVVRFLPVLLCMGICLAVFASPQGLALAGLISAVAILMVMFYLHMQYYTPRAIWQLRMESLFALLDAGNRLSRANLSVTNTKATRAGLALTIGGKLTRFMDSVPRELVDCIDWFTLGGVRHYFRQMKVLMRYRAELRDIFLECAEMDANSALARYLDTAASWCWAQEAGTGIRLTRAVHPLLHGAQPLSIGTDQGMLLTGQNGAGKSTLLRMIGLNALTARAFGFCHAESACVPDLSIFASLRNDDSLVDGESLYMAELRRARELLDIGPTLPALFLIDEIFRGTNYLESVAAAAAFLDELSRRGMVMVSTHHGVLAPLLEHRLPAWHLLRDATTGQVLLGEGVLAHTNGIVLLEQRGFGPGIQAKAEKVFGWLSGYLAHPVNNVTVLHD